MFWKVASLESGESGKLSLESDSLESCGREKDVAPFKAVKFRAILAGPPSRLLSDNFDSCQFQDRSDQLKPAEYLFITK